jgi:hypothetical protein
MIPSAGFFYRFPATFLGSALWDIEWLGVGNGMRNMTGRLIETPRDDFMLVAERELIAFARKERELRKQERLERVKEKFPALINVLQS